MCEFCKDIRTDTDFKRIDPYIIYGNYCEKNPPMFYIEIPTDDDRYYSVDNIKFCPYCGTFLRF